MPRASDVPELAPVLGSRSQWTIDRVSLVLLVLLSAGCSFQRPDYRSVVRDVGTSVASRATPTSTGRLAVPTTPSSAHERQSTTDNVASVDVTPSNATPTPFPRVDGSNFRPILVFLDPGHGGADTGGIGSTTAGQSVAEKTLV